MNNTYQAPHTEGGGIVSKLVIASGLLGLFIFIVALYNGTLKNSNTEAALSHINSEIVVLDDNKSVLPENEGKSLGLVGTLLTEDIMHDDVFDVHKSGLLLQRKVQIYQQVEKVEDHQSTPDRDGMGRTINDVGTLYSIKEWVDAPVDTRPLRNAMHLSFEERQKNVNEGSELFYKTLTLHPQTVKLGAYVISPKIMQHKHWEQFTRHPLILSEKKWPEPIEKIGMVKDNALHLRKAGFTPEERAEGYSPQIGDLRLRWFLSLGQQDVSLVAQQQGETLVPVSSSEHDDFFLLEKEKLDIQAYLEEQGLSAKKTHKLVLIAMFIGFWVSFAIILKGVRMGARQSALFEGWMSMYRYCSSALLALLTLTILYSLLSMTHPQLFDFVLLFVSLGLSFILIKLALRKGRNLVFSGPTRVNHHENSSHSD